MAGARGRKTRGPQCRAKRRATQFLQYDAAGRLEKSVDANGLETILDYWPRGWLKSRQVGTAAAGYETTSFDYDDAGQLSKVTLPDGSFVDYTYDAAHRLTDLTAGEYDATGAVIQETVWLEDLPVATLRATVNYVHPDHLGTPRAATRASDNALVWRWDNAEPFGDWAANEDPGGLGAFAYNLRFPGQYFDCETGTAYNYFRTYDASLGRYIQSDPIGLRGGVNTYSYVGGAPILLDDPRGLEPPRKATCYWWDRPDNPYNHVFGVNRQYRRPIVTLPWPFPGDPMPDYVPYGNGGMRPSCMYWWRPPRRCELACMATSTAICATATFGAGFLVSQTAGRACQAALAEHCERSCGQPQPCASGNDFSYGAP